MKNGQVIVNGAKYEGSAAVLMAYPHATESNTMIGIVASTDNISSKVLTKQKYFMSGSAYPDLIFYSPETLRNGQAGVIGAAMFDNKWQLENAESLMKNTK